MIPIKILVLGDTHGQRGPAVKAVKKAANQQAGKIVQVGDFGLWTHFRDGVTFLDDLNEACRQFGIKFYAVGGNHENWDHWEWFIENNPRDKYGFAHVRSHIMLAPRTHFWKWDDKQMAAAGGAVSVDKGWRILEQGKNRTLWWDNEELTDEHVEALPNQKVDYLFTHDCSNRTPFKARLKPDADSQIHRQRIDRVLDKLKPNLHFHGHMHEKYDWVNRVGADHWTQTYGLDRDGALWNHGVLDTQTDEFVWAPIRRGGGGEWDR